MSNKLWLICPLLAVALSIPLATTQSFCRRIHLETSCTMTTKQSLAFPTLSSYRSRLIGLPCTHLWSLLHYWVNQIFFFAPIFFSKEICACSDQKFAVRSSRRSWEVLTPKVCMCCRKLKAVHVCKCAEHRDAAKDSCVQLWALTFAHASMQSMEKRHTFSYY